MFALCDQMGKEWGIGTYSSPKESPGKGRKRLMIGQNTKAEVAPSSVSRNRGKRKSVFEERCRREQMGVNLVPRLRVKKAERILDKKDLCLQARAL